MRQWGERDVESRDGTPAHGGHTNIFSRSVAEDVRERRRHRACVFKNATFVVVSVRSADVLFR